MFPIRWNKAFRKKDGSISTIGAEIDAAGGGGGGSFTPDYDNDVLIIGTHGDYNYFIPMQKTYIGQGIAGYEIKTNPDSSPAAAKIDLYSIIYDGSEIVSKNLIKTLIHNTSDKEYEDDNISITYNSNNATWVVTSKVPFYDESGNVYQSPLTWLYGNTVDYTLLLEDPT